MRNRWRRFRLIKPELQTQAIFVSLGLVKVAVALTCLAAYFAIRSALADYPGVGQEILAKLPKALGIGSLVAMAVITPALLVCVIYATQRIAGPAFRMEQYLKSYLRGENQERLSLREKDELQVLANLLDMALAKKDESQAVEGLPAGEDSDETEFAA